MARLKLKPMIAGLALAGVALNAHAAPVVGVVTAWVAGAGAAIGGLAGAAMIMNATAIAAGVLKFGVLAAGMYYQRNQQKKAARRARDAYNAALEARNISVVAATAPRQYIYGTATVGGVVVDFVNTGETDEFNHVIIIWAAHECDAVTDIQIAGESIGPLDADGWVTTGKWAEGERTNGLMMRAFDADGTLEIPIGYLRDPQITSISRSEGAGEGLESYILPESAYTFIDGIVRITDPAQLPRWAGRDVAVNYTHGIINARVRVRHHLGSPDQAADAELIAISDGYWTDSDRLAGRCYSIITMDLRHRDLQSGLPQVTATVRGKRIYDPRTDTKAWSDNPALCALDFLTSEYGKGVPTEQVTGTIAAANACDEIITVGEDTGRRYTCNGAWTSDSDPDTVLENIAGSMAGFIIPGGVWTIQAGVFTSPVAEFGHDQAVGAIAMVPAPGRADCCNSVRGQFYDPAQFAQSVDYEPVQVQEYVDADAGPMWQSLSLPFTNEAWRARTLARIFIERSRGGQLVFRGSLETLRANVGDRVAVTNRILGLQKATYRVSSRKFSITGAAVEFTLTRDTPQMYEIVGGGTPAPSPTPPDNAYNVLPPQNVTVTSPARGVIRITFDPSRDVRVTSGGMLIVQYRLADTQEWISAAPGAGDSTSYQINGLGAGVYVVRVDWRNVLGAQSNQWVSRAVEVQAAWANADQGSKADTAVQPGDLAAVATSGDYNDLINRPALGSAASASASDFAPAAQTAQALADLDARVSALENP